MIVRYPILLWNSAIYARPSPKPSPEPSPEPSPSPAEAPASGNPSPQRAVALPDRDVVGPRGISTEALATRNHIEFLGLGIGCEFLGVPLSESLGGQQPPLATR